MISLPDDIQGKDVLQWLHDGWFLAKLPTEELVIARLNGASNTDSSTKAEIAALDGGCYTVPFTKLFAHWPICGALNINKPSFGKFAISLTRLQKKQWKRTYNSHCLRLRVISDNQAHHGINSNDPTVIKAAFKPEYFTYTDAVKYLFRDGWTSVALSPNLIVLNGPKQQMVFVDGELSGIINNKTQEFVCSNPGLKRRLLPQFDYMVE